MKEAENFLKNLLKINDTIVLGVSGGPDSMCLLHLVELFKDKYNLNIICAHVHHNLRKESDAELEFVKNYCFKNNITFEYMKIDSYENNRFTESEARNQRYNFFGKLINKYNANYLMTAHHGDDLTETILMRIVRGSNLKGYLGISKITKYKRYSLVRPLLYVTKDDILKYLRDNNIEYVIDKSNEDEKYTRNRYRKHLLSFLKNEDKNVHLKFLQYSEELEKSYEFIKKIVDTQYNYVCKNNVINIDKLVLEDRFIQEKIIERVIETIQMDNIFNISKSQLNSIYSLIYNNENKSINLSNNYIARKSYNKLIIEKKSQKVEYKYEFYKELEIMDKYKFEVIDDSNKKSNFILRINSEEISLPLIIRTRKDGDKIKIKNLNGSKKVKDILIDEKMDMSERDEYPIVTDSKNEVIWIPGIKKSIFDKEISEKYDIIIKYVEGKNE